MPFCHKKNVTFTRAAIILPLFFAFLMCGATSAWALGTAPGLYSVGVRSLAVITEDQTQLGVAVWYPSGRTSQASYHTRFGAWVMQAEKNVSPAKLVSPVILLSHDMASHNLANHELACSLAANGFVVIAPTHSGDSVENASALYSAALLYSRPLQMHEALRAVTEEPAFEGMLDLQRVGLLGVGSGALTVLQLCGVDIDESSYAGYCDSNDDAALCSQWAASRFSRLPGEVREIRSLHGPKAFIAPLSNVKAVGMLTPGWVNFANRQQVSGLRVPAAVLFAGNDGLYAPVRDGEDVLRMFSRPLYDSLNYHIVPGVDHYSLSAECPSELLLELPEICGKIQEKERKELAEKRDNYFASFFKAALGVPLPR